MTNMVKLGQGIALFCPELYRPILYNYIQNHFSEYNPQQILMFGIDMDELVESFVDKILSIPIEIEWTDDPREMPHGTFHVEKDRLSIIIGGVNHKKYNSPKNSKYINYVDSVLFHELIHATNYLFKPWDEVSYTEPEGPDYYGDEQEQKAYSAQMKDFLGLSKKRTTDLMNQFTYDKSHTRQEWMNYLYDKKACSNCDIGSKRKNIKHAISYMDIGHNDEARLWFYNKGKLLSTRMYENHSYWPEFKETPVVDAQGRIDHKRFIGSCDFYTTNEVTQKKVIEALISEFPEIKFTVFKQFNDPNAYPNPESLNSFYEKLDNDNTKTAQLIYTDIGHNQDEAPILWFYSNKLFITVEHVYHASWPIFQKATAIQAQGRVDLQKNIGSCAFYIGEEHKQKIILEALISEFPGVQFTIFPEYYLERSIRPQSMQEFYEHLSLGSKRDRIKISTIGNKRTQYSNNVPDVLVKTAASGASTTMEKEKKSKRNETYTDFIADSDRYLTDAYYIIVSLRETVDGFSVACHFNAGQLGTTSFAQYWHYKHDEYNMAKKTFQQTKTTVKNIRDNCEYERLPFSLILPMCKHETRKIDTEHMEVPQIPHIMYGLDVANEKDWRETLYGGRYPAEKPNILNYDIDHSLDEKSRYVVTTPGLGRNKLVKYKYASIDINKPINNKDKHIGTKRKQYIIKTEPFFVNPNAVEPIDQVGDK